MSVYYGVVRGQTVVLPTNTRLDEGQRVEVRVMRRAGRTAPQPPSEELFRRKLQESGLLCESKADYTAESPEPYAPIRVMGKSLSEVLLEERR